ncbi:hypothetical protein HZA55_03520 [Candidatus Poribacteria bacterium]|nr:hypothetical protein [Candidatus Poribacteria bacterium]
MEDIIKFEIKERKIECNINKEELEKRGLLDGCYVITTENTTGVHFSNIR